MMNSKKAFTLLEVTIAITLFMILVLFLYKTLDQTKHTNKIFEQKKELLSESNHLNNIFLEDIAESFGVFKVSYTDDKTAIVKFESYNTFHNGFHNHITYLISSNDKLVRIESYEEFKGIEATIDFYENAYIDILLDDIELFEVSEKPNEVVIIIKQKNKEKQIYKAFRLGARP